MGNANVNVFHPNALPVPCLSFIFSTSPSPFPQRLVSAEHGLALSRQACTSMYVETSAINNDSRSTNSAFEVRKCLAIKVHTRRNPGECRSLVWLPLDNSPGHPLLRDLFPGVAQGG